MRNADLSNAERGMRSAEFEGLRFDVSGVDHCSERPVDEFRILHSAFRISKDSAFLEIPHSALKRASFIIARMNSTRLEAFSDAVIAILMTIMVLELKIPHGANLEALSPLLPIFLTYILSFIYLAIYWNNHHHMLQVTKSVNGKVLWANMHLLFWLSMVPFVTGWMGENHFAPLPTAIYGVVLLCAAISYTILQTTIVRHHQGENELLAAAIGRDLKGKLSIVLYIIAIASAFLHQSISHVLYAAVALIWLVPDKRIEKKIDKEVRNEK